MQRSIIHYAWGLFAFQAILLLAMVVAYQVTSSMTTNTTNRLEMTEEPFQFQALTFKNHIIQVQQ